MGKLFGTDGIRGVVGENLTAELAYRIGQAVTMVINEKVYCHYSDYGACVCVYGSIM